LQKPPEFLPDLLDGRNPKLLLDIHTVSEVNKSDVELSLIEGPAHSEDFSG
jgi:NADH-quinone oxidoreductase subunit G